MGISYMASLLWDARDNYERCQHHICFPKYTPRFMGIPCVSHAQALW